MTKDITTNSNDIYLQNVERLEPDISTIWGQSDCAISSTAAASVSAAMSLKRIADTNEKIGANLMLRASGRRARGQVIFVMAIIAFAKYMFLT